MKNVNVFYDSDRCEWIVELNNVEIYSCNDESEAYQVSDDLCE